MAIKEVEKLGKDGRALMGKRGEGIAVIRVFALLGAHPPLTSGITATACLEGLSRAGLLGALMGPDGLS